jgi:hypothetical protein
MHKINHILLFGSLLFSGTGALPSETFDKTVARRLLRNCPPQWFPAIIVLYKSLPKTCILKLK